MRIREPVADVGVGMIGGYVGTKVMEPVSMKLYELESEEIQRKEDEARPGPPYLITARKITEALGIELSDEQFQKVATVRAESWCVNTVDLAAVLFTAANFCTVLPDVVVTPSLPIGLGRHPGRRRGGFIQHAACALRRTHILLPSRVNSNDRARLSYTVEG